MNNLEQWRKELQQYYNLKYFMESPKNWQELANAAVERDYLAEVLRRKERELSKLKTKLKTKEESVKLQEINVTAKKNPTYTTVFTPEWSILDVKDSNSATKEELEVSKYLANSVRNKMDSAGRIMAFTGAGLATLPALLTPTGLLSFAAGTAGGYGVDKSVNYLSNRKYDNWGLMLADKTGTRWADLLWQFSNPGYFIGGAAGNAFVKNIPELRSAYDLYKFNRKVNSSTLNSKTLAQLQLRGNWYIPENIGGYGKYYHASGFHGDLPRNYNAFSGSAVTRGEKVFLSYGQPWSEHALAPILYEFERDVVGGPLDMVDQYGNPAKLMDTDIPIGSVEPYGNAKLGLSIKTANTPSRPQIHTVLGTVGDTPNIFTMSPRELNIGGNLVVVPVDLMKNILKHGNYKVYRAPSRTYPFGAKEIYIGNLPVGAKLNYTTYFK